MIGLDQHKRLVYEGSAYYGYAVWPAPYVLPATLIERAEDWQQLPASAQFGPLTLVFREDSFDAVTRVRRGRLYKAGNTQPMQWHVQPHPMYREEVGCDPDYAGWLRKPLDTFHIYGEISQKVQSNRELLVAVGAGDSMSMWSVVLVERHFTGEDVITMRGRVGFGILPRLLRGEIPAAAIARVEAALTTVADAVYRSPAVSIIDRCRDAAQVVLAEWFANDRRLDTSQLPDLARLAADIEKIYPERQILLHSAKLIARLHARGKPNEQLKRKVQPPTEGEAEASVALLGTILREIGWASA